MVPSRNRALRLRWLLNALAEQTLPRESFEVIVAHDSRGPESEELLRSHPLAQEGVLRHVTLPPVTALAGRKRNIGWRRARAPIIAFTDDDCRPPPQWLERALRAARGHPDSIVQGATSPDPEEIRIAKHAPWIRTVSIRPPRPWAETCNIVYPREVLERHGGFPEDLDVGEDTALAERARESGIPHLAAPEMVTFHAVYETTLLGMVRGAWRWRNLPLVVRRHPRLRRDSPLWFLWKREHGWLPVALAGWVLLRRSRLAIVLMLPYVAHVTPRKYGQYPRGRIRAALELPGWVAIHTAELLTLAWGSVRHRTFYL